MPNLHNQYKSAERKNSQKNMEYICSTTHCHVAQGFQYFSSVPVRHYLQEVFFIKILISMNILYNGYPL